MICIPPCERGWMAMSLSTSYVAEGTVEVDGAAMGIGEVDQGILDLGTGGMFPAPDTGDTVFMDPDPDGGVMDRIGALGALSYSYYGAYGYSYPGYGYMNTVTFGTAIHYTD